MNEQDLIRRVTGLLKKAESTHSEHEASAFFAKAQELMLKYSIDEARVREQMGMHEAGEKPIKVDFMYSSNDAHAKGKEMLLNVVAKHHGCRFLRWPNTAYSNMWREGNKGAYSQWGVLVGYETDIAMVKVVYTSLLIQASRFASEDWRALYGSQTRGRFGFVTGHMVGFTSRVDARYEEMKAQVLTEETTALVVRRDDSVNDAVSEFFPTLAKRRKGNGVNAQGWFAGHAAGDRADLGGPKIATPAKQLEG